MKKLSAALENWIGKPHHPQRYFGVNLLSAMRAKLKRLLHSKTETQYRKNFVSFSQNPGNFSAGGSATGKHVRLDDGTKAPISKTFYYNSISPEVIQQRFYSRLDGTKKVSVIEKHEQTKVRPVATVELREYEAECYLYDFITSVASSPDLKKINLFKTDVERLYTLEEDMKSTGFRIPLDYRKFDNQWGM